jgi:hypothetical protein
VWEEETRNAYKILVKRLLKKCSHRRPSRKWEDNIKMALWEVVCGDERQLEMA